MLPICKEYNTGCSVIRRNVCLSIVIFLMLGMTACVEKSTPPSPASTKLHLLALERNWLEAEFRLDTGYIAPMIADSFMGISEEGVHNKQQLLESMYSNISQRLSDSIIVESFRLENEQVRIYDNTAVVTFVIHTFKKNKGVPEEKKTRFYDVWVKTTDAWKMVASQGTSLPEKLPTHDNPVMKTTDKNQKMEPLPLKK